MSSNDGQFYLAYLRIVADVVGAHAVVVSAFYQSDVDFLTCDGDGAHDRRLDIDKLQAEMMRLSKMIGPSKAPAKEAT